MDDAYEFSRFFPDDGGESTLNEYIGHHSASIKCCLENNLFSSAYSHLHLLYMVFIYVQLLRIAQEKKQEFEYGGLASQVKRRIF